MSERRVSQRKSEAGKLTQSKGRRNVASHDPELLNLDRFKSAVNADMFWVFCFLKKGWSTK